jgi:glucosamine--fructose-6-phosphate aminotransferase (isomerizing)
VVKDARPWDDVWHPRYLPALHKARVALGHTRHATQGAPGALANAAPLVVGATLIGAHNGDSTPPTWSAGSRTACPPGRAAPTARSSASPSTGSATTCRRSASCCRPCVGRRRSHGSIGPGPRLVFLARGALCPLAVAGDRAGNLYWASSPAWFRRLDARSGDRLRLRVAPLPEDVLLAVAAGELPTVVAERSFVPVARPEDEQRFPSIWTGLDASDLASFRAMARHRVADPDQRPRPPAATAPREKE